MNKIFTRNLFLFCCYFFLLSCNTNSEKGLKVIAVKDGDTIQILENGKPLTIRLYGVDAPEKNQDFGTRAKQFASDLAFGKNVKLIKHNTDRYGRTVGTVMLPDGKSLNAELIKNGMAWHYKAYSKDQNLANLEVDARRYKRGLWSLPNPMAPWDFRKNKGNKSKAKPKLAKKPTLPLSRRVLMCDSDGAKTYHLTNDCHILKRCKQTVKTITVKTAVSLNRNACKICIKK